MKDYLNWPQIRARQQQSVETFVDELNALCQQHQCRLSLVQYGDAAAVLIEPLETGDGWCRFVAQIEWDQRAGAYRLEMRGTI